nr:NADH dehydrogenase subunit 1 [Goniodes ortygis]
MSGVLLLTKLLVKNLVNVIFSLVNGLEIILFILISVAFFSLFERKLMGLVHYRKGPNKVGVGGFLQPFADAMKLISKIETTPTASVELLYWLSPLTTLFLSMIIWLVYPVIWGFFTSSSSMLIVLCIYSLSVYGVILSGWFSLSKYATIGCVRALAQSISYEIGLTLVILLVSLIFSSMSLEMFVSVPVFWSLWFMFPLFILFEITLFAETNRSPFDLAEGESELVGGFSVEYGGLSYTLIFLGENLALLFAGMISSILFFNGSIICSVIIIGLFVVIRSQLPRVRFDKVMKLFWEVILPLQMGLCLVVICLI